MVFFGRIAPMDSQDRELLQKTFQLAEENNAMLRKMRRSMRVANAMRIVYWLIIIGLSVGALYFIQPYIDQLLQVYSGAQSDLQSVQNLVSGLRGN